MSADVLTDVDLDALDALDFAPTCERFTVVPGTLKVLWECQSAAEWLWVVQGHCKVDHKFRCSACLDAGRTNPHTCMVCFAKRLPPPKTISVERIGGKR